MNKNTPEKCNQTKQDGSSKEVGFENPSCS